MDLIKGNSLTIDCVVYTDQDLLLIANLTGATIKLYVKKKDNDLDINAILNKTGTVTGATTGQCQVTITAAESNALTYQKLALEIVAKLADGTYIRTGVVDLNLFPNVGKTLF